MGGTRKLVFPTVSFIGKADRNNGKSKMSDKPEKLPDRLLQFEEQVTWSQDVALQFLGADLARKALHLLAIKLVWN